MTIKNLRVPDLNLSDFSFHPLDPRFVSSKPQHSIDDKLVAKLESERNLIISRKRDGYYHTVASTRKGIDIYTRTNNLVTHLYPNVVEDLRHHSIPYNTLVRGEIIVDENGSDAFPKVAKLAKTEKNRQQILEKENLQANFMPFDIIACENEWLHPEPNAERFEKLMVLFEDCSGSSVKPFELLDVSYETARERMRQLNWEGLVLYHRLAPSGFTMNGNFADPYRPYGAWKKKDKHEDDFVVVEKIASTAKSWPGALKEFVIVQYHPVTGEAIPCGKIGNGFTKQQRIDYIDDKKFPTPFVVQVRFSDRFIDAGKGTLRFGDFVTIRGDKSPEECLFPEQEYKHTLSESKKK